MKLWKLLLVAMSVATLPFALVAVGQAQQLTCWGLRPTRIEDTEETDNPVLGLHQREDSSGNADAAWQRSEDLDEAENTGAA
jgi:hypothetical protein